MTSKINTYLQLICALFIFLFCYTALSKLEDFDRFRFVLSKSPFIGSYSNIIAAVLPTLELVVAVLLFIPRTKRWGLYSFLFLMTVFTIYIGYMILFTPHLPCSCGGVVKDMTWKQHLVFNLFFIVLALFGIVIDRQNPEPRQQKNRYPYSSEWR